MNKNDLIEVIIKEVGCKPIYAIIPNDLTTLQNIVGGLIEVVMLDDDLDLICNEEGKIMNLETNLIFDYDYIVGNVIVCSHDEMGNFTSLTPEQQHRAFSQLELRDIIN